MTAYQKFPIGAPFNVLMARDASASLTQIEEMAKQLNARMTTLDSLITRYQDGLKKVEGIPDNIKEDLEARAKEVNKLAGELSELQQKLVDGVNERGIDPNSVASVLIRNKAILDQASSIQRSKGKFQFNDLNARNIVTLTGLGATAQFAANDLGRTVERALTLLDWISFTPVTAELVPLLRESAYEIMADLVPEGQTKPESNLTFGVVDLKVGTIAHWIKISIQLISDMPTLAAYIEGRLAYGVRLKLEAKIVVGDGVTSGARSFIGLIETNQFEVITPGADDTAIDVINRAKYKAASTGLLPEAIILNPEDWGAIERIKGTDGHYIFGSPGAAVQPVLWGLPVILSAAMTSGKYWVGNLTLGVSAFIREDVAVELSTEDGDNFVKNLCTVRAEMRACCGVAIPDACAGGDLPATATPPAGG
ncbi:phage major capsid protein [Acinetobacter baumannii]|uniref:phage major capsid protein n=1 Tax=Acinetobacter baumannii TaxID=470 RepID=UPI00053BFB1B|nr:phage major capsid protein [Acinetobacter baumannii]HAV4232404.1 phage major capsid protein [Acinetobacter baumannii ATCC 17978]EHU1962707.1 phage major capsid protein [Acinetobacter baumannii]EHU2604705.1 phage major capsid protein [Acinetobacter baumannii]EHU3335366.1 phage major capsid protein [Acinetobacter baumannii]ELA6834210.1 phage major capsid protein [Acinetobacter baumannii]